MTALRSAAPRAWRSPGGAGLRSWIVSASVLLVLACIVASRWLATIRGVDALAAGAGFGLALATLWVLAQRSRRDARLLIRRPTARHLAIQLVMGTAFGLTLVGLAVVGASIAGSPIIAGLSRPAAPFLSWAAITVVVATAEEGVLRGVLFDRLRGAGGLVPAVAITTIAFALMHVPLYGWHVVPLDLAVGLALAGLRLSTGTVLAPAIAHAVADIATWWL
jgi:membrane protease YdiL (CAAX protease family)